MPPKLSALLVQDRVVSFRQMDAAVQRQRKLGGRVDTNLLELGHVSEDTLLSYLERQTGLRRLDLDAFQHVDQDVLHSLPTSRAVQMGLLPLLKEDGKVVAAVVDPLFDDAREELEDAFGAPLETRIVLEFRFWQAAEALLRQTCPSRFLDLVRRHPLQVNAPDTPRVEPVSAPAFQHTDGQPPGLTWTIAELGAFYEESESRDEVLLATLGFVGKFCARRMWMVVGRDELRGFGMQGVPNAIRGIDEVTIKVSSDSPLKPLIQGESYYLGSADGAGLDEFYGQLGVAEPRDICVVPVRIGPRAALLLVCDNDQDALEPKLLPIVFVLTSRLSATLVRLIKAKKKRHSSEFERVASGTRDVPQQVEETPTEETKSLVDEQRSDMLAALSQSDAEVARGIHKLPEDGWDLPDFDQLGISTKKLAGITSDPREAGASVGSDFDRAITGIIQSLKEGPRNGPPKIAPGPTAELKPDTEPPTTFERRRSGVGLVPIELPGRKKEPLAEASVETPPTSEMASDADAEGADAGSVSQTEGSNDVPSLDFDFEPDLSRIAQEAGWAERPESDPSIRALHDEPLDVPDPSPRSGVAPASISDDLWPDPDDDPVNAPDPANRRKAQTAETVRVASVERALEMAAELAAPDEDGAIRTAMLHAVDVVGDEDSQVDEGEILETVDAIDDSSIVETMESVDEGAILETLAQEPDTAPSTERPILGDPWEYKEDIRQTKPLMAVGDPPRDVPREPVETLRPEPAPEAELDPQAVITAEEDGPIEFDIDMDEDSFAEDIAEDLALSLEDAPEDELLQAPSRLEFADTAPVAPVDGAVPRPPEKRQSEATVRAPSTAQLLAIRAEERARDEEEDKQDDPGLPPQQTGRTLRLTAGEVAATQRAADAFARVSRELQAARRAEEAERGAKEPAPPTPPPARAPQQAPSFDTPDDAKTPVARSVAPDRGAAISLTSLDGVEETPPVKRQQHSPSPIGAVEEPALRRPADASAPPTDPLRADSSPPIPQRRATGAVVSRTKHQTPIALDVAMPGVLHDESQATSSHASASHEELYTLLTAQDPTHREGAFAELLERGEAAFRALSNRFPGPLYLARRTAVSNGVHLEQHGPLVWLAALQARALTAVLRDLFSHPNPDARYYAAEILSRAHDASDIPRFGELLFDSDDQIRGVALGFLDPHRDSPRIRPVHQIIRGRLQSPDAWTVDNAIQLAAEFKDEGAVPALIQLLDHTSSRTRNRAASTLVRLTFQDLGNVKKRWDKWYRKNAGRSRRQWLLEAMVDSNLRVRMNASRELRSIPRLMVNYDPNLDRRSLKHAQRVVERFLDSH